MSEFSVSAYQPLNEAKIDKHDYTNSLTEAAMRLGLLTEDEFGRIRADLMTALADVIGYYTENQSTSLKADTAKELSRSLIYNIDTYLRAQNDHAKALALLKDRRMSELYGKGYLINKALLEEARTLYGKVRLTRLRDGGEAYDKTIDKYYRYYLSHYSPKFGAHDKIYLSLPRYGMAGNYNIRQAVAVLRRLLEINTGKPADVVLSADQASGTTDGAQSE